MPPQRVLDIETDVDLKLFSAYLWQQGVAHRVFEQQGRQIVELRDEEQAGAVQESYAAWRSGALQLEQDPAMAAPVPWWTAVGDAIRGYPVLAGLIVVTLICYPATWSLSGAVPVWAGWLSFVEIGLVNGRVVYGDLATTLASGQLWRFVTPILLHFSVAHLLFNIAVVVEFGRRVERGAGGVVLMVAVLSIAATSNLAQYLWTGPGMFGGASGVAYGLVGFVIVRSRRWPDDPVWRVNQSFAIAVVVFLILMSTGVTELFGLHIANAAHWIGLVVGALLGLSGVGSPHDPEVQNSHG